MNTIKMSNTEFQLIMILGILIGNALSVIIPYFRKLNEGKIESFDIKYLYHAVSAAVWQSVISIPLWVEWESPSGVSWLLAFVVAIAFGFGGKNFQEQVYKYIKKSPKLTTQNT